MQGEKIIENVDVKSVVPKKRQELLKWYGWGYKDSEFQVKDNMIHFTSPRYMISTDSKLENFLKFIKSRFDVDFPYLFHLPITQVKLKPIEYPEPILSKPFFDELKILGIDYSLDGEDRLIRSHGQTINEIYRVRVGDIKRIPDIVVWPKGHDDVVKIVKLAHENNVVLIVYGGGTSVSGAIMCPENETRCIVSLDTSQMNKLLWLNKENLTACFESGIVGQDLERVLNEMKLTLGHEPDSIELSTLGGWVATRASGMKKNIYGNIEDIVLNIKMVTCKGVYDQKFAGVHKSSGPNIDHLIFGSEGTLGVITEVTLKIRPMPKVKKYGSLVFPNFDCGLKCLREVAFKRCQPASIRLMDNEQFLFGQALKIHDGFISEYVDGLKKFLLTHVKGYSWNDVAVVTLLFEGDKEEVEKQEKVIFSIAKKYRGLNGGSKNGEKGYILTYVIAYIRDLGLDMGLAAESFETSVPWSKCASLCDNVKLAVAEECQKRKIKRFYVSCRVTQTYDAGACVYFYFGFQFNTIGFEVQNPIEVYHEIEDVARDVILASGGSISHHHGVGKLRKKWYKQSVSPIGVNLYKAVKSEVDPRNIFACDNFLLPEDSIDHVNLTSKL